MSPTKVKIAEESRGLANNVSNRTGDDSDDVGILDLPRAVLSEMLTFVGPGRYRFVAGMCLSFREAYLGSSSEHDKKKTTWESVVSSTSCLCLFLEEAPEIVTFTTTNERLGPSYAALTKRPKVESAAYWATRYGRVDVLRWILQHYGRDPFFPRRGRSVGGYGQRQASLSGVGEGGCAECLEFFLEQGLELTKRGNSSVIMFAEEEAERRGCGSGRVNSEI